MKRKFVQQRTKCILHNGWVYCFIEYNTLRQFRIIYRSWTVLGFLLHSSCGSFPIVNICKRYRSIITIPMNSGDAGIMSNALVINSKRKRSRKAIHTRDSKEAGSSCARAYEVSNSVDKELACSIGNKGRVWTALRTV